MGRMAASLRTLALPTVLALIAASANLTAQRIHPQFRFEFGVAPGWAFHDTDGSNADGDTSGALLRARFEGVGRSGFGGGIRFENWGSDDDLFVDEGFAAEESRAFAIFPHFTYRIVQGRFRAPIRVGIMAHNYELENVATGQTTLEVDSFGPRVEIAPEFVLHHGRHVQLSAYGEFGFAVTYSEAEVQGFSNDFDSSSGFLFLELGMRTRFDFFEIGAAFVTQGMFMAESDIENNTVVNGFDANFTGFVFTGAFVF